MSKDEQTVLADIDQTLAEINAEIVKSDVRYRRRLLAQVAKAKDAVKEILDRDTKLDDLYLRADALEASAILFKEAMKLKRKPFWWQNTKMLVLSFIALIVLIVIIIWSSELLYNSTENQS